MPHSMTAVGDRAHNACIVAYDQTHGGLLYLPVLVNVVYLQVYGQAQVTLVKALPGNGEEGKA